MNPFDFNRYPVSDPERHVKYARDLALWGCGVLVLLFSAGAAFAKWVLGL